MVSITLSTYSNLQKKYKALQDKHDLLEESHQRLKEALAHVDREVETCSIQDYFDMSVIKKALSQIPATK